MNQQLLNKAKEHHQAGRLAEACSFYQQVLAQNPPNAEVLMLCGMAQCQAGNSAEGIKFLRQAAGLEPNRAEIHHNLGFALANINQWVEAIVSYRSALAIRPGLTETNLFLGMALYSTGDLDGAAAACRKAIALRPNSAEAHNTLGNVLKDIGLVQEGLDHFARAMEIAPDFVAARSNEILARLYHPDVDPGIILSDQLDWNQRHARPLKSSIIRHENIPDPDRRLRIGYVSSDFHQHACAMFLDPLLRSHDHDQFEITCYSNGSSPDWVTKQFERHADRWHETGNLNDEKLAGLIRNDRIDILIDCKLHTAGNRLLVFARKPAPVQISWLGYPGCVGMETIDYHVSDRYLEENGSALGEPAIVLPDCFWCYDPQCQELAVNPLPAMTSGHITFGCLNSAAKINDRILELWGRILQNVTQSRLLLLAPAGLARRRILETLQGMQIDPSRVGFVDRQARDAYLSLYHKIDICLDTLPYNGHTTSLDALWMGVALVTLVGRTAPGRVGLSHLMNLQLSELAAQNDDEYVRIAVKLAADLPRLGALRSALRQRMEKSPLMDGRRFAKNMEAAYRDVWRKWCKTDRRE